MSASSLAWFDSGLCRPDDLEDNRPPDPLSSAAAAVDPTQLQTTQTFDEMILQALSDSEAAILRAERAAPETTTPSTSRASSAVPPSPLLDFAAFSPNTIYSTEEVASTSWSYSYVSCGICTGNRRLIFANLSPKSLHRLNRRTSCRDLIRACRCSVFRKRGHGHRPARFNIRHCQQGIHLRRRPCHRKPSRCRLCLCRCRNQLLRLCANTRPTTLSCRANGLRRHRLIARQAGHTPPLHQAPRRRTTEDRVRIVIPTLTRRPAHEMRLSVSGCPCP